MKQSYWENDLYSSKFIEGTLSTAFYELSFSKQIKVSDLVELLDLIKEEETNKIEYARGNVFINGYNPIVLICQNEDTRLPVYEEYKDKPIKKAYLSVEWCAFNFMLDLEGR